jgi:hypothetical protein
MRRGVQSTWLAGLAAFAAVVWSSALARDSVVVFNEVHYQPPGDEGSLEWVELHNQMAVNVDMSAWRIDGGIQFDFALGTVIPGGGYLIIARDPAALQAATGVSGALGPFAGALANGGEEIVLYKHNRLQPNPDLDGRRLMDRLDYGDNHPWPVAPDGSGATLAKRDPDTGTKQPRNWTWSGQVGGTPGAENFPSPDDIPLDIVRVVEADASWRFNETGESFDATWAQTSHPEGSNWRKGLGALGFERKLNDIVGTPLVQPTLNNPYVATHYFETDLELTADTVERLAHFNIEHLIDDGAVIYINGVEVHRHNMPEGTVDFETLASGGTEAEWIGVSQLSAANLVAGINRVSVEVHQSSFGSSDVVFGLTLDLALGPETLGGPDFSAIVLNEIGAADGEASLIVELYNSGSSPIPLDGVVLSVSGDPAREFVVADGTVLEAGHFFVLDDKVIADPIPILDQDRVFLFSPNRGRVIDARQASASLRGRVPSGEFEGRWLRPDKPTFGAENSFALQDAVVINEIFYHAYPEPGFRDIPPQFGDAVLVPLASEWRYFENVTGEGLPTGWASASQPDWPSGAALLGREPSALDEPIRTPLSFSVPQLTYYFETEFDFLGDMNLGLRLRHFIDDGAVFYLNGVEIGRFNMLAGPVTPDTRASPSVGNAEGVTQAFPDAKPVEGRNRLAVELHQSNAGSSDIIFGAEVLGKTVVTPGIPGKPFTEPTEEWIELLNRSTDPVDITGWRLEQGVEFVFPEGTVLEPGGYLVVADDADALGAKYPEIKVSGSYRRALSNRGERIVLSDSAGNPADEVHYYDSGRWPVFADGGGSSLELRDGAADNRRPEAWAASDESGKSVWQTYTYRGVAENDRQGNNIFMSFF